MKKIILSLIFFGGFLFAQSNYEAKLVIEDIYWHTQNEWRADLRGELYLNSELQVPSQEYYYHWQWKKEGEWEDRITSGYWEYTHFMDGNENSFFLLRLQITGPGFSALSEEVYIGKNGSNQLVTINSYKEDGSIVNDEAKIKFWGTYKWRDNGESNVFYLSTNQDNYVKDSIVSIEQFSERFNKWVNRNPFTEYYTNHAAIYIESETNEIDVKHRTFKDATLNTAGDVGSVVKVSFKDPWLIETKPDYFEAPYGHRNLGSSAIFEEVNNGTYNIGINSKYQGVFLDQDPAIIPTYYSVRTPLTPTVNGSTAFFGGWSTSDADLQQADPNPTGYDQKAVVFTFDGATVTANYSYSTITTNTTLNAGTYNIAGTLTVPSGVTLTVNPGATLKFPSGGSLVVNGKLIADNATFTSASGTSPNSWEGIQLNGSGSSGSTISYTNIQYANDVQIINVPNFQISYSTFTDNYTAVYVTGSTGSISNNYITSSSIGHGINIQNYSTVNCNNNVITKTNRNGVGIFYGGGSGGNIWQNDVSGLDWGIGAIWSSSVTSQLPSYPDKNNRIDSSDIGIMVYRNSYANFGYKDDGPFFKQSSSIPPPPTNEDLYGANSIYNNTINASVGILYSNYPSGLYAMDDWWGSSSPNTSLFSVGSNAYFYYDYYLTYDPWVIYSGGAYNNKLTASVKKGSTTSASKGSLIQGIKLRLNKRYKEAKDFFVSYIAEHPDNQQAYVELYNSYSSETADDIIGFFNSLPSKASKDNKLLLAHLYLKQGKVKKAKKVNNNIIKKDPNTSLMERAMINNVYIALYNENNIDDAVSIFREVLKHPELSTPMELNEVKGAIVSYAKSLGKDIGYIPGINKGKTDEKAIPKKYELFDNYPNPFNPTTTINYQLPKEGLVTLIIYDMLGREVKTLVNEFKTKGSYSVNFNAGNLASGVYIYRINVNNFSAVKKLLLMK